MISPSQSYFLSVRRVEGGLVVHPIGNLARYGIWMGDEKILGLAENIGPGRLYLDCRGISFLSSEALGRLITVWRRMRDLGGRIVLCGLNSQISDVLHVHYNRPQFFDFLPNGPPEGEQLPPNPSPF